jgi:hypothetical protein
MANQPSHTEQGQIERAQRLRQKINQMKQGVPSTDETPAHSPSLKEQIEDRANKLKTPAKK